MKVTRVDCTWRFFLPLVTAACLAAAPAGDASKTYAVDWATGASGSFQNAASWSPAGVPNAGDVVDFAQAANYTVSSAQDAESSRANFTAGYVTLDLGGRAYSLLADNPPPTLPSLLVSGQQAPTLKVINGELNAVTAVLGAGEGGVGTLEVLGSNAVLNIEKMLYLGNLGSGFAEIESGAQASTGDAYIGAFGPNSQLLVTGIGSRFDVANDLRVALLSQARVEVRSVATLTAKRLTLATSDSSKGYLGSHSGALVHIQGDAFLGAAWAGGEGEATMWAENGRIVIDGELRYDHRSTIRVLDTLAELDVGSMKRVDDVGGAVVAINNGAMRVRSDVNTFDLSVDQLGGSSTLQIDGTLYLDPRQTLTLEENATLTVGSLAGNGDFEPTSGTLNVSTLSLGGAPELRTTLEFLGTAENPPVRLNVSGATSIEAGGALRMLHGDAQFGFVQSHGAVQLTETTAAFPVSEGLFGIGGLASLGDLTLANSTLFGLVMPGPGSTVETSGTVRFNGSVRTSADFESPMFADQPKLNFNGGLRIGSLLSEIADIEMAADVTFASTNRLELEILSSSSFDMLRIDGGLTLDGILDVRFLPDYMPAAGDSFQLFVANRMVGEFEQLLLPSLPQGLSYELASINAGLLRIVPEPALPMWGALVGVMAIRRRGARGVMRFGRWR